MRNASIFHAVALLTTLALGSCGFNRNSPEYKSKLHTWLLELDSGSFDDCLSLCHVVKDGKFSDQVFMAVREDPSNHQVRWYCVDDRYRYFSELHGYLNSVNLTKLNAEDSLYLKAAQQVASRLFDAGVTAVRNESPVDADICVWHWRTEASDTGIDIKFLTLKDESHKADGRDWVIADSSEHFYLWKKRPE